MGTGRLNVYIEEPQPSPPPEHLRALAANPSQVGANELYPGVDRERQLERLRQRLFHMHANLPELTHRPQVTECHLMLDVDGCHVDAVEILPLAGESPARAAAGADRPENEAAIAATAAESLPD